MSSAITWSNAQSQCQASGGALVKIDNAEEYELVKLLDTSNRLVFPSFKVLLRNYLIKCPIPNQGVCIKNWDILCRFVLKM